MYRFGYHYFRSYRMYLKLSYECKCERRMPNAFFIMPTPNTMIFTCTSLDTRNRMLWLDYDLPCPRVRMHSMRNTMHNVVHSLLLFISIMINNCFSTLPTVTRTLLQLMFDDGTATQCGTPRRVGRLMLSVEKYGLK